ncbi:MAG TPA: hypothetical protein VN207_02550 [Ktedonobacteraceae bacterium]|nr:hypothetical protein [Ktedonobacteraceae bacterium]
MDPLTLILTVLGPSVAASVKETASQAVKEGYNGLKTLIHNKLAGKPTAEIALAEYEKKPDVWKAPLEEGLKEAGIVQDKAIIDAAEKLMTLIQPQQAAQGKYNVQITGNVQGFAQGDHQSVNMNS